jgi:hypothetical protein
MQAKGARRSVPSKGPTSEKLAISFEKGLAAKVRRAAGKRAAGNISAWLAVAAREQLRLEAGRSFLHRYESEKGVISKEELAEVRRQWPRD